ncbi:MAG: DoxX family protein [Candidatus Lambdaproteobacteria bacterium]|nr:DoxX family protein [Candidatus Lambdaproteobacteria bacterium]
MQDAIDRYAPPVGRILLSIIMLVGGFGKITGWAATAGYMQSKGIPIVPLFLVLALVIELVGGVALVLGFWARWAAAILFLYLIPVSLVMHNFWALEGMDQQINMVMFLKNLAIMGGLAYVAAHGAGAWSLERPARR